MLVRANLFIVGIGIAVAGQANSGCLNPERLNFRPDGTFKIMQITDTQDDHCIEARTVELITKALATEQPDLVVFSGDNITGLSDLPADIPFDEKNRIAINNIIDPVEAAGIPFIITFGNHDADAYYDNKPGALNEPEQLEYYRSFSCNLNRPDFEGRITGTGEMVALIWNSDDSEPVFTVWGLDSGRYAPNPINGQNINQQTVVYDNTWDYIRQDQVDWYVNHSKILEHIHGKTIPGLMFFHIPLFEHEIMWNVDAGWTYPDGEPTYTGAQPGKHSLVGERNECICTGPFNSGLFAAMLDRGDIKGVFVGHDHINNYHGNFYGITLGYGASSGFGPYGFGDDQRNRLRGIRTFVIHEDDPTNMQTTFHTADEYGVDTADPNTYNDYPPEICPPAEGNSAAAAGLKLISTEAEVKTRFDGSRVSVGEVVRPANDKP
jgi:hypothetical protein